MTDVTIKERYLFVFAACRNADVAVRGDGDIDNDRAATDLAVFNVILVVE